MEKFGDTTVVSRIFSLFDNENVIVKFLSDQGTISWERGRSMSSESSGLFRVYSRIIEGFIEGYIFFSKILWWIPPISTPFYIWTDRYLFSAYTCYTIFFCICRWIGCFSFYEYEIHKHSTWNFLSFGPDWTIKLLFSSLQPRKHTVFSCMLFFCHVIL